jgi:Cu(I)/Ag(I) efflux system membrane protein CusA/SilA
MQEESIAAPMVGGLLSVVLMSLLVYPAVFAFWKARTLPAQGDR